MKNSFTIFSFLFQFFLLNLSPIGLFAQNELNEKEIHVIAERELKTFLEIIPVGLEVDYGFANRNEFKIASLGKPINVLFPSEFFYSSESVDTINANYEISPIWELPILVDGKMCCFLKIRAINNSYSVIGIGGSLIAKKIGTILDKTDISKSLKISLIKFPEIQYQYLIEYNQDITYRHSKCFKIEIENDETSERPVNVSLFNILVFSKQLIKERNNNDHDN
jgi:hypothetical protein